MTDEFLRIYSAVFPSLDAALGYSEAQWEPEPNAAASDDEYAAWEARNPTWAFKIEIGLYLDSDFVETYYGSDCWNKLEALIGQAQVAEARSLADRQANTLIVVFERAIYGIKSEPLADCAVRYLGKYKLGDIQK